MVDEPEGERLPRLPYVDPEAAERDTLTGTVGGFQQLSALEPPLPGDLRRPVRAASRTRAIFPGLP
jgi:hypothetical protein